MNLAFNTFTQDDSNAYAGACDFKDGSKPLIATLPDLRTTVIIAGDPDGLQDVMAEIFFVIDADTDLVWSFFRFFDHKDEARGYLLAMADMNNLHVAFCVGAKDWMRGQ